MFHGALESQGRSRAQKRSNLAPKSTEKSCGWTRKVWSSRLWRVIRLNERMSQRLEGASLGLTCVFTSLLVPPVL